MRKKLQQLQGERRRFSATVKRFGTRPNWHGFPEATVLLGDVQHDGAIVTDHLWMVVGKTISSLDLKPGDLVTFDARVTPYTKGYVNHRDGVDERTTDFRLERATRWQKCDPAPTLETIS